VDEKTAIQALDRLDPVRFERVEAARKIRTGSQVGWQAWAEAVSSLMSCRARFLVCPPEHYGVEYVINPWMDGNVHRADREKAAAEWQQYFNVLSKVAETAAMTPRAALPDLVFTANGGLVLGRNVILGHFMHRERRPEEPWFREWFEQNGFNVQELPRDLPFEGEGDALWDGARGILWAAYGPRTELDVHPLLAQWLAVEVVSLRLVDKRFYHLDTCLAPLEGGHLMYYEGAFDAASIRVIESRVPPELRIAVSERDALHFACNAVCAGTEVLLNAATPELHARLEAAGYSVHETRLGEFIKSGGAAKCLALRLAQPRAEDARRRPLSAVQRRVIEIEGHLLDAGLLERALDLTVDSGGSFHVLDFQLGKQRQSTSRAAIGISAPSADALDAITSRLIELGARPAAEEPGDAELRTVEQAGVAPEDFYATTIYPTEVRCGGEWLRVLDQRMDAVVVVRGEIARCKLLRDLAAGEQVVVGTRGIRTLRAPESRELPRAGELRREFAFMGAGVSSERRVELVVEQIAWEMARLRERGGRVVVVPGPVVIHTGAGEHLAWLVREGYIGALLGGNAIAVHDLEQAILGTSLGVDLQRGQPVRGGHSHHVRVINTIRRYGGIAAAVEQGVVRGGIFYECVKKGVPFALAGSIRDDGPLPETEMDLIKAQTEYARLIRGAEMILMLSTMLHSIGVGNMTPAGVKLVCVDINPAVVTKLADRGSIESAGIVTDVGLFLSLLHRQLDEQRGALPTPRR
jgi:lysine-ketoglutarate reductase/saccharopine dehydrogenase-like protein (TIGR00300 family)